MKHILSKLLNPKFILALILLLSAFFRLYGLNWDQGQHLHPDERFLTMVASAIKIPSSLSEYLNPQLSPMSPYNNNYSFFVYGTFPLFFTKVIGVLTNNNNYGTIHFVGRILSAFFDVGTVLLVYFISRSLLTPTSHPQPASQRDEPTTHNSSSSLTPLLAAFLYSIMVLPIQLSHFFAVDTFLNFFIVLSFYFLVSLITPNTLKPLKQITVSTALGLSFGFALACKISALYFLPIIGLGFLYFLLKNKKILFSFSCYLLFAVCCLLSFRFTQPTAFSSGNLLNWTPNPQFVSNLKELKGMSGSNSWYPPSVQWHSSKPIIFPLKNLVLWGMGLPLGILSLLALFYSLISLIPPKLLKSPTNFTISLITLWILLLFIYQGTQFVQSMRYFLPIYPFLAILAGNFLSKLNIRLISLISLISLIYPLSFLSIYSRPITRVSASKWIYENVPASSTVTFEEWDDGLPLGLPNYQPVNFKSESLFMYDEDTPEKWQKLNEKLDNVDYYFITSNRAYGSIMKLPKKYPQTTAFYQSLFDDTGYFKKVAEFTSRPCFPPFGEKHIFCFNDDKAEEAFTVYDHPKVLIFKRK